MNKNIKKSHINQYQDQSKNKQEKRKKFNIWLAKIGPILNTSQISNYK